VLLLGLGEPVLPLEEGGEIFAHRYRSVWKAVRRWRCSTGAASPSSVAEREILQTALSSFGQA